MRRLGVGVLCLGAARWGAAGEVWGGFSSVHSGNGTTRSSALGHGRAGEGGSRLDAEILTRTWAVGDKGRKAAGPSEITTAIEGYILLTMAVTATEEEDVSISIIATTNLDVGETKSGDDDFWSPETMITASDDTKVSATATGAYTVRPSTRSSSISTPQSIRDEMTGVDNASSSSSAKPCGAAELSGEGTLATFSASIKEPNQSTDVQGKAYRGSLPTSGSPRTELTAGRGGSTGAAHEDANSMVKTMERVGVGVDAEGTSASRTADVEGQGPRSSDDQRRYTSAESIRKTKSYDSGVEASSGAVDRLFGSTRMGGTGGGSLMSGMTGIASSAMSDPTPTSMMAAATTSLVKMAEEGGRGNGTVTAKVDNAGMHEEHEENINGDTVLEEGLKVEKGNGSATVLVVEQIRMQSNTMVTAEAEGRVVVDDQEAGREDEDLRNAGRNATSGPIGKENSSSLNNGTGKEAATGENIVEPVKVSDNATVEDRDSATDRGSNGTANALSKVEAVNFSQGMASTTRLDSAVFSSTNTTNGVATTEVGSLNATKKVKVAFESNDTVRESVKQGSPNTTMNTLDTKHSSANFTVAEFISSIAINHTFSAISEPFDALDGTISMEALLPNSTASTTLSLSVAASMTDKVVGWVSTGNTTLPASAMHGGSAAIIDTHSSNSSLGSAQPGFTGRNATSSFRNNGTTGSASLGNSSMFAAAKHDKDVLRILAGNYTMLSANESFIAQPLPANASANANGLTENSAPTTLYRSNATLSSVASGSPFVLERNRTDPSTANSLGRNATGLVVVENISISLNDNKIHLCDTPCCLNETGAVEDRNVTGLAILGNISISLLGTKLNHTEPLQQLNQTTVNSLMDRNGTGDIIVGNVFTPFDKALSHSEVLKSLNETAVMIHLDATLARVNTTDVSNGNTSMKDTALKGMARNSTLSMGHMDFAERVTGNETARGTNMTLSSGQLDDTVFLPGTAGTLGHVNTSMILVGVEDNATVSQPHKMAQALNLTLPAALVLNGTGSLPAFGGNVTAEGAGAGLNVTSAKSVAAAAMGNVTGVLTLLTVTVSAARGDSTTEIMLPMTNGTAKSGGPNNATHAVLSSLPTTGSSLTVSDQSSRNSTTNLISFGLASENMANIRAFFQVDMGDYKAADILCSQDVWRQAAGTLNRDDFDTLGDYCGKSEAAKTLAANQGLNATLTDKFTHRDGNASEYNGPMRTSQTLLTTGSISITPALETASSTATYSTQSTSRPRTTSFISTSSSFLSSTNASSSMRTTLTDCASDFDFFEMSDANLAASNALAWYANWTLHASTGPSAATFHSIGEVPYFGRVWLRTPDYNCGLELGGCTARLSCNEILRLYPGDVETARKVYFVMRMQGTVNQVLKSYYDAVQLSQINVGAVLKKIVDTAFQTPLFEDQEACKFLKTAYNNLYSLITELAMPVLNGKKGLGSEWFKAPPKSEGDPSAKGVSWLQFKDIYGNKNAGFGFWKGKAETAWRWWFADAIGSMQRSVEMCDGLGMVSFDKGGAQESLGHALAKISMWQRRELSRHVQFLNRGAFKGEGEMSALAGILGMGIWNNETSSAVGVLTDPYQLEEMMTAQSKETLLSRAYLMNKCYLKCTTHPHALSLCAGYNDWEFAPKHAMKHGYPSDASHPGRPGSKLAEAEKLMRICPRPDKVCQLECWSQEKKGWTMPLHNIGRLGEEPLGVDIQQKMREIYEYYKVHGNANPHPSDENGLAEIKENPHAGLTGEKKPGFWLPVCDSDQGYTHIVDFGKQKHGKYRFDQWSRSQDRRSFPISCGDYRSDQTTEFMSAMGLTNWHTKDVKWTMNPFFKNYAPLNAAVLIEAPLDNFLALCRLGVKYPEKGQGWGGIMPGQMHIRREPSRFCKSVDEETKGMPWWVANVWFCKKSERARELFGVQGASGMILGLGKVKNHGRLCERWLSTWEGEQMVGMEKADGSQSRDRWSGPKDKVGKEKSEVHKFSWVGKGNAHDPKYRLKPGILGRRGASKLHQESAEMREEIEKDGESDVDGGVDMEEVRREEEMYWKEFRGVMEDEEELV